MNAGAGGGRSAGSPGGAGEGGGRGMDTGAVVANHVRRGFYLDSVALMRISASLSEREGVESASLMIGSPSNLAILDEAGLLAQTGRTAGPDDLVLAVRAESEEALAAALDAAQARLEGAAAGPGGRSATRFSGLGAACEALSGANLAIVSVPGPFAAREARRALARGLHVLVFSDNVPVEEEVALKREARARGLALMGPDCGTAIIAGTPIAFANRVRRGEIGAIAASGTGLQELSVLVHRGGGGLSHGIGVGGRDLGDDVGGIGTFMALDALESDPGTRHIVIVSKPPGPRTEAALLARLAACPKPVTLCLVGRDGGELPPNAVLAPTLRDAARLALGGDPGGEAVTRAAKRVARRAKRAAKRAARSAEREPRPRAPPTRRPVLREPRTGNRFPRHGPAGSSGSSPGAPSAPKVRQSCAAPDSPSPPTRRSRAPPPSPRAARPPLRAVRPIDPIRPVPRRPATLSSTSGRTSTPPDDRTR